MTAKQTKDAEADEAIERRRREFNEDGYDRAGPHGDPLMDSFARVRSVTLDDLDELDRRAREAETS